MHYKEILRPGELYGEAFKGRDVDLTIKSYSEDKGDNPDNPDEPLIRLFFEETDKFLKTRITNCKTIGNACGSHDMNDWIGKTFTFFPLPGKWFGEKSVAIRVRPKMPAQKHGEKG